MAIGIFNAVASLLAACGRQVSRVSRKIGIQASSSPRKIHLSRKQNQLRLIPFLGKKKKKERQFKELEEKEEGVWRRNILMGEKCQPLEFSGAIFYDGFGNRLPEFPPRSPMRNSLPPSFAFSDEKGGKY